jgi:hypothetical protein
MSVVPQKKIARVEWYEGRIAAWTSNATAIGTTAGACTDMAAKITAARAAWNAKVIAEAASEAATNTFYTACDAMGVAGQAIIKNVRSKAESTGDMEVYSLAMIPPPATPTPAGPPGTPGDFSVQLDSGALMLKWKCSNPVSGGVVYQVYRRTTPAGEYEALGIAGEKRFIDATVPAGSSQVTYKIRGVRPTAAGMWAEFNVTFGMSTAGATIASVSETTPKLAA